MIWVIVLRMTIINLGAPELMSNTAFPSEEICKYAISDEPHSDRVACMPMKLVVPPTQHPTEKPKGESLDQ
jgi:hypothetical protein